MIASDSNWWVEQAACRGCDPALFHPDKGDEGRTAKAICEPCPVRAACLDYALANLERHGIWGGLSERERRNLRRRRRLTGVPVRAPIRTHDTYRRPA